ncbi:hypothetical protein HK104_003128 [Borealophlyctis nickersoniae]|nr:hypothetical protein HK104_003128 [Borealophlyctis nickersoniae]
MYMKRKAMRPFTQAIRRSPLLRNEMTALRPQAHEVAQPRILASVWDRFPTLPSFVNDVWGEAEGTAGRKATLWDVVAYCNLLVVAMQSDVFSKFDERTESFRQRSRLLKSITALIGPLNYPRDGWDKAVEGDWVNADGFFVRELPKWRKIEGCVNYWVGEVIWMQFRKEDVDILRGYTPFGFAKGDKVWRTMSKEEAGDIEKGRRLRQGHGSFERHKWFYLAGGAPGVQHSCVLEATLKAGAKQMIEDLARSEKMAAIVEKEAEPQCFGIHEEVLDDFSRLLTNVTLPFPNDRKPMKVVLQ